MLGRIGLALAAALVAIRILLLPPLHFLLRHLRSFLIGATLILGASLIGFAIAYAWFLEPEVELGTGGPESFRINVVLFDVLRGEAETTRALTRILKRPPHPHWQTVRVREIARWAAAARRCTLLDPLQEVLPRLEEPRSHETVTKAVMRLKRSCRP